MKNKLLIAGGVALFLFAVTRKKNIVVAVPSGAGDKPDFQNLNSLLVDSHFDFENYNGKSQPFEGGKPAFGKSFQQQFADAKKQYESRERMKENYSLRDLKGTPGNLAFKIDLHTEPGHLLDVAAFLPSEKELANVTEVEIELPIIKEAGDDMPGEMAEYEEILQADKNDWLKDLYQE